TGSGPCPAAAETGERGSRRGSAPAPDPASRHRRDGGAASTPPATRAGSLPREATPTDTGFDTGGRTLRPHADRRRRHRRGARGSRAATARSTPAARPWTADTATPATSPQQAAAGPAVHEGDALWL